MSEINQIKLLVATGLYPPDIGGPATYSRMIEEKLPAHNIVVSIVPFRQVRYLPKILRHIAYAWILLKQTKNVDCIYALDPVSVGLPALVVSLITRKPFMVRLGGDYAWEQGQQRFSLKETLDEYTQNRSTAPRMVKFLAAVQSFVVQRAWKIIAPSDYLKSIIETWGVDSSRVEVIYSALFPLEIHTVKAAIRERLLYSGTVVATVGRLVPWKGFDELIDVIADLRKDIPDIMLVIIGGGPMRKQLNKKIIDLKLEGRVRMVGKLSKDALGAAIKGADLFVLNTSYEGFSHQLLEVMDLGVPIITTRVGGNPELISDGVSGVLVPVHDTSELSKSIKHLLNNKPLQLRLIQNARVRTKDFNQDVVVAQFADILHSELLKKDV